MLISFRSLDVHHVHISQCYYVIFTMSSYRYSALLSCPSVVCSVPFWLVVFIVLHSDEKDKQINLNKSKINNIGKPWWYLFDIPVQLLLSNKWVQWSGDRVSDSYHRRCGFDTNTLVATFSKLLTYCVNSDSHPHWDRIYSSKPPSVGYGVKA